MNEIKYAPVIIFTLCRYKHFKNEIESLKKNAWAKYTDVYIGFDYPAKDEHWDGYKKICEYLENGDFSVFNSFTVFKREKNYGPANNHDALLDYISERYDRWIYLEDDMIFSPNFIEYIDKCLAEYEDNENIIAVNGYSYPLNWKTDKDANILFQSSVCATWGIGHWKEKYFRIKSLIQDGYLVNIFDEAYKTKRLNDMIEHRRMDYIGAALGGREESYIYKLTDFSFGMYMSLENKYVVTPKINKVRNCGFDGTGLDCKKISRSDNHNSLSYDYANQPVDLSETFELIPDSFVYRDENKKLLDDFLRIPTKYKVGAKVLMAVYRLLGIKKYKSFMSKVAELFAKTNISYVKNVSFDNLVEYVSDKTKKANKTIS